VKLREAIVICMRGWRNDLTPEIFCFAEEEAPSDASELQECDFGGKIQMAGHQNGGSSAFPPDRVTVEGE
jgi:hypothetical protein